MTCPKSYEGISRYIVSKIKNVRQGFFEIVYNSIWVVAVT